MTKWIAGAVVVLLLLSGQAFAQGTTTPTVLPTGAVGLAQKLLLTLRGVDAVDHTMMLPTGCTVAWAVHDEKGAVVEGVADFVEQAASAESPGGWWFVPKGKMGTYIVKATVTLPAQQSPLAAPAEAKMIVQGDIVKVIIGFTGSAVPK
jgi:hypothetical protein